jgi:uncharacterized protein (DUF305 family)
VVEWFDTEMPGCSTEERAAMPGFLTVAEMRQIKVRASDQFDSIFVESMSKHHSGAVKMADQMWHSQGDIRLRAMAHAIRHEQQGKIALMEHVQGLVGVAMVQGLVGVAMAFRNMLSDNVNSRRSRPLACH